MTPTPPQGQIPPRRDSRMGAAQPLANQIQPAQSPIVGGSAMPPPGMGSSLALPGGGAASVPAPAATGMDSVAPPDSGPAGMPIQGGGYGGGAAMPQGGAPMMGRASRPAFMPPPGAPMGMSQAAPPVGGGAVNPGNGIAAPASSVQMGGTPQPAATGYPGARPQPPSPQGAQMTHPQPPKPMGAMSSPMSTGAPPPDSQNQYLPPGTMPAPGMAKTDQQQADFSKQQRGGNDLQTAGRPNLNKRSTV